MATRAPDFITFTGADSFTDIGEMCRLAARYPIEWGILFSPSRQGRDQRYPGLENLVRFAETGLRLAAHLCGGYSDDIMAGRQPTLHAKLGAFQRIQVNCRTPDMMAVRSFQEDHTARVILQTTDKVFPNDTTVDWLFDVSGGQGMTSDFFPEHPGRMVGYAGGLGPKNVVETITAIGAAGPFWIDMESKVRTNDRFDLELCEAVCRAVYG